MAKKTQSRSQAKAANKSRPASTSQPTSTSATLAPITAYSPFSPHFAILTQAIDRHRLTVYSTSASGTSRLLVDYVLPAGSNDSTQSAHCSALCWVKLPSSASSSTNDSPQAKRQKKGGRASLSANEEAATASSKPVLALGLQSGQVHLFDLSQGKVVRVLKDSAAGTSSASASNAVTSMSYAPEASATKLYATAKDGVVRVWSLQAASAAMDSVASSSTSGLQPTGKVTLQSQSSAPNTLVSVSPSASHLLVANHTITRLDEATSATKSSYTSHASPMTHLTWIDDEHFVSAAKNDPVLYVWKSSKSKAPIGTIELEQGEDVIRVESRAGVVVVVGSQGFVGVYDTAALIAEDATKGTKLVKATSTSTSSSLVDVRLDEAGGRLDLARLIKGVKLDLTSTQIKDPATSSLLSVLSIPKASANSNLLASGDDSAVTTGNSSLQRYSDATAMAGKQSGASSSSAPVGSDGLLIESNSRLSDDQDDALNREEGGVDDERSLEDRLRGLRVIRKATKSKKTRGGDDQESSSSESDEDEDVAASQGNAPNTSLSLATSLSQALHSSDAALISSLLTSSNPDLIKGTVLRLSGPNAVLLLEACVTRLNASKRGPQKARGMVEWIKWTLRLHAGYLMSLPGLTSRLASLHSSLSARLNGHDRMLALQGRLELVLGHIELRSDYDVVKAKVQGASARSGAGVARIEKEGKVWKEDEDDSDEEEDVEEVAEGMDVDEDDDEDEGTSDSDSGSDSDSEDEEDDSDVPIDAEEEEGDVEDVGLDSRVNGSSVSKAGTGAAASSDEEDEDEDDVVRPASRRAGKVKPAAGKGKKGQGLPADQSDAEDDDDDGDDDEVMDGSEEDSDEDEDDESDLLDDDEDEDEDEDDEDDEDGEGGLIDDEAEEASEDEEEDSTEEE